MRVLPPVSSDYSRRSEELFELAELAGQELFAQLGKPGIFSGRFQIGVGKLPNLLRKQADYPGAQ